MNKVQFRVLYREFLFRIVDLELLSPQGDMIKLLGQFAALLVFVSIFLSGAALGVGDMRVSRPALLVSAWAIEHLMIATTMLVVGLFAVLSWDATFPDRRDVLVLAPLPIKARTLFLAKVTAAGTALGVTMVALNAFPSAALSLALTPPGSGILDVILSSNLYRTLTAYWATLISAGGFVFCCVLGTQGVAAQLLPRRQFLRLSAVLQIAAFCLFLSVYFLEPSMVTPQALAAVGNQRALAWLPSYWFLGLFQQLNGSLHAATTPLARRAWTGLAVVGAGTAVTYVLSYFRTIRKIVEEPDIVRRSGGLYWSPRFGGSLETALCQFSLRTLLRSRQHRMILSFYLGIGLGLSIFISKAPVLYTQRGTDLWYHANVPLLVGTILMICAAVVGMRVVFSMPLDLRANWTFRVLPLPGVTGCLAAIRRSLFSLAVAPTWVVLAAVLFWLWPWQAAAEHLLLLGLLGVIIAELSLHGFQKIPFTCSYLPGKSKFNMAALAFAGLMFLLVKGAELERSAFESPLLYTTVAGVLVLAAALARWRTSSAANAEGYSVQFEDLVDPAIQSLDLHRDGGLPIEPAHP